MIRLALALALLPGAGMAAPPPGLLGAVLHPGWVTAEGNRMAAVELTLEPGWKTYWRSPGEAGIEPLFDWSASENAGRVTYHWPAPEVIDSGGMLALGFEERLLLPVEIAPLRPGEPVALALTMDLGLCRDICIPAHLSLAAPPPGESPDPAIEAALSRGPAEGTPLPACETTPTADGFRLAARLPEAAAEAAAIELATGEGPAPVWVSQAELSVEDGTLVARADAVPEADDYAFDPATLRLTLIGNGGAVEYAGCAPG
ncbi:hypothetical protein GI374_04805 [Paracoccus sp. S-4012]|uniref:protein-disulfide reductase DsbD domain-containing protein n=1 Tax=Paracoccus sp. S-4012 TaxID=2665648 RepID=UPI0012AEEDF1|nr:protein-disulfide reductase DsbD domain-containing protein [Paracoccus sp. S-4012]MRX49781.1 hypothetical protein [Paracoccus sp. S-4012]